VRDGQGLGMTHHESTAARLPAGVRPGGRFGEWTRPDAQLVVVDVDGTLIARGATATQLVADSVAAATRSGLLLGVATGRMAFGVADLLRQLAMSGPHVVSNGAQIVDRDACVIKTWPIDRPAAEGLIRWCGDHGLYTEFSVGDEFFATDRRESARRAWDLVTGEPHGLIADVDLSARTVVKATVHVQPEDDLAMCLDGLRRLGLVADPSTSPLFPGAVFVNVTSPETSKGHALSWTADHLGIELANVMAIGDEVNDISMLTRAGTAVAMGQAPSAVRQSAHLTVADATGDGVAYALRAAVTGWART
jgi:Cof subfamily protein (haloacid dehalogenase superfamily)